MSHFVRAILKTLVIAVITFCLAEIALRLFPGIIPPSLLYEFDPQLRQEAAKGRFLTFGDTVLAERDDGGPPLRLLKPHTVERWYNMDGKGESHSETLDENGFCNPEGRYSRPQIDLITIGDSFTWCHAVSPEATWTEGVARYTGMSAYNLGRGGIGLYEYIQILKHFGLKKAPRVVVLAVYEGNDLRDAQKYHAYRDTPSSPYESSFTTEVSLVRRYSYAVNLFYASIRKSGQRRKQKSPPNFRYQVRLRGQEISFNVENTDTDEVSFARLLHNRKIDFHLFDQALEQFVALGGQNGFLPVVGYIPSAHTAYAKYVQFADSALSSLMPAFSQRQRDYFRRQEQQVGFRFIDLTPNLQLAAAEGSRDDLLYLRGSLHLTSRGHEVIAKGLGEFIQNLMKSDHEPRK